MQMKYLKTVGLLQPDLILLDIKLDHSNGLDVCREIKNSYLKDTPVYIMSGLPDVDKKAYDAGADYFLPKTFRFRNTTCKNQIAGKFFPRKFQFLKLKACKFNALKQIKFLHMFPFSACGLFHRTVFFSDISALERLTL